MNLGNDDHNHNDDNHNDDNLIPTKKDNNNDLPNDDNNINANINVNDNDSDSEDDEDYVPPATDDINSDNGDGDESSPSTNSVPLPILSSSKQKAVDDAFLELFGKPYVYQNQSHSVQSSVRDNSTINSSGIGSIDQEECPKALKKRKILSEIFGGSSIASKLMKTSKEMIENDEISRKRKDPLHKILKKEVTEKIKFAGQMMDIQRTVVVIGNDPVQKPVEGLSDQQQQQISDNDDKNKTTVQPTGIDAVLSQIKGPQKFTTLDKTNVDWENFKDKAGLEDELKRKAESKDAYLVKKDFLNRVDVRRFEQERDERNRKRAAANSK